MTEDHVNILTFNYEYPPLGGGGGVIHQHIAEELAQRHRVAVVTSQAGELPAYEEIAGVEVHRVPVVGRCSQQAASMSSMLSYFPSSLRVGDKVIRKFRPDIINSHFAIPTGPSAVLLARRHGLQHVLTIHGGDIFDPSKRLSPHRTPGLRHTVRWVLRNVDRVLAGSQNTATNARRLYGVSTDIDVIPYGLKEPKLGKVSRRALGFRSDQVVCVTVGRLVARKANHQLIEILARMRDDRLALVIIGDGPERNRLADLITRHGLGRQVHLAGQVSEAQKYELMLAADMFVSTTLHEGFGLMYLEAMFCGLPIVTYDHGGQTDFLENGQTGFLISLNDQTTFEQRLKILLENQGLRARMGNYNLGLSQAYTVGVCARRYEAVFEEVLLGVRKRTEVEAAVPAGVA